MIRSLIILATLRCDLTCAHCLQGHPHERPDFPLNLYARLLRDARPYGANLISFTGGEPRLHPEFDEMLRLTVEMGYVWNIASNGQNADVLLRLLEKYGERNRGVVLSLDGATPGIHDQIRQRQGAFERLRETAQRLVTAGYTVKGSTCLNQINRHQLQEIVDLGANWGLSEMKFAGVIPEEGNESLRLSDAESLHLVGEIEKLRAESEIRLDITSALYTAGGINFCPVLNLRSLAFGASGEMLFCCDARGEGAVLGELSVTPLDELLARWLDASARLQQQRAKRISQGQMGEGFDTCAFCAQFFDE